MASPININTASLSELKSIPNVGEKRGRIILQHRDERGPLTLEDIKMIPEIPSSIWDPLVSKGTISFEPVPRSSVSDTEHSEESPIRLEMCAITRKMEDLQQIVLQQKEELICKERFFEDTMDKAQREHKEALNEQRDYYECRERDLLRRLEEVEHGTVKVPKQEGLLSHPSASILGHLPEIAPGGIYGKHAKMTDKQPHFQEKKNSQTRQSEDGNKAISTKQRSIDHDDRGHKIKMPTYDGKAPWKPYHLQFSHIANRYKWTDRERLDKFIECLRDKALKFFSTCPPSVRGNFVTLCQKMNERFGKEDLPHIVRRQLQDIKQNVDETVEEFAERAMELATDGYPNLPERCVEMMAVDGFLKGLKNKTAALTVMDKNPETWDEAVQLVKSAIANQKLILGSKSPNTDTFIKRVSFVESPTDEEGYSIRKTVYEGSDNLKGRLQKTEEDLADVKKALSKIFDRLNQMEKRPPTPPSSPRKLPSNEQKSFQCYGCGEVGHFRADCPKRFSTTNSPVKRSLSPTFSNKGESPLNYKGLRN